jgi:hypothetical protein
MSGMLAGDRAVRLIQRNKARPRIDEKLRRLPWRQQVSKVGYEVGNKVGHEVGNKKHDGGRRDDSER